MSLGKWKHLEDCGHWSSVMEVGIMAQYGRHFYKPRILVFSSCILLACHFFLKLIAAFKIWSAIFHESQYICSVSSWMPEDNFQVCSLSCAGVGGVWSRGGRYLNKPKLIFNQSTLICNIVDYGNVNHTQQVQRLIICQNIIFSSDNFEDFSTRHSEYNSLSEYFPNTVSRRWQPLSWS